MLQRRHFVQTLGVGSAVASLGVLGGCASAGGSGPKVVVIGGGYAGATAAKYLRLFSDNTVNVTLVEPNASFVSCPISNLVINGSKTIADVTTPYDNLEKRHGIKLVRDMVASIDVEKRVVKLASVAKALEGLETDTAVTPAGLGKTRMRRIARPRPLVDTNRPAALLERAHELQADHLENRQEGDDEITPAGVLGQEPAHVLPRDAVAHEAHAREALLQQRHIVFCKRQLVS